MPQNIRIPSPHSHPADAVIEALQSTPHGLSNEEAALRLQHHGPNLLPQTKPPGVVMVFLSQFLNPLIYILLAAAAVSLVIEEYSDAVFIFGVLLRVSMPK